MRADPDRVVCETPLVKIGAFRCAVDHPRFMNTRPLDDDCFVFPRNPCWIEIEGHRPFIADSTTVPLYNRGQAYRRAAIDPDGDFTDWFAVRPDVLREALSRVDPVTAGRSARVFSTSAIAAPASLFIAQRRVFEHVISTPAPDAMFVEESVLALVDDVVERAAAAPARRPAPASAAALANDARLYLTQSFLTSEGVSDVAAHIGVSPFHLCRVFRRETGHTLHRYRTELRLRWSLQPLADGVDILSVALAAGFAHHSHFTNAFRRAFGARPSEFRASRLSPPQRALRATPLEMMKTRPD